MKRYNWTFLCRDTQKDEDGYGHSFWRDENSGRISIKDESGDRPDTTDDGPLWLSTKLPWKLGDRGALAQVEVERTGETSVVSIIQRDAPRLAAELGIQLVIDTDSDLGRILPHIRDLPIE